MVWRTGIAYKAWKCSKSVRKDEAQKLPEVPVNEDRGAGYKTPAIAKLLLNDGVEPLFSYKRPMTKNGFFRKHEYVYDEMYDCICALRIRYLNIPPPTGMAIGNIRAIRETVYPIRTL